MFRDQCLQQRLVPMLRGGRYESVRDLILAFASNERVNQSTASILENLPSEDPNNMFDPSLPVTQSPANNVMLQGLAAVSQQPTNTQPWGSLSMTTPMYDVPNLQHQLSQPSLTQVPSDSGMGSMISEHPGRDIYPFDSMGAEGTASAGEPGEPGRTLFHPYFNPLNTMYPSSDNCWVTEEKQSWGQSNGDSTAEDFQNL